MRSLLFILSVVENTLIAKCFLSREPERYKAPLAVKLAVWDQLVI